MAKPANTPLEINAAHIADVASREDDFGFELRVGAVLRKIGKADHAGTYTDPVEGRPRQFDYRCTVVFENFQLLMAVECKNLSAFQPMVVCQAEREASEAYHQVIAASQSAESNNRRFLKLDPSTFYERRQPVGKSTMLVKAIEGGVPTKIGDGEIYGRWSQALASSHDLLPIAWRAATRQAGQPWRCVIIPAVVVPDGALWQLEYGDDGKNKGAPTQVEEGTYFVGYNIPIERASFTISHLHFFTLAGLENFLWRIRDPRRTMMRKHLFGV